MQNRTNYIGGSDCAALLGLSRWKTPLQLWAEKTGQVIQENISDNLCVKLGIKLEKTIAELFYEETGKKVQRVKDTIYHPKYEFIGANIDRKVVGEKSLLEAKTCSVRKAKEWEKEEIPQEYILQCIHYLAVTGYDRAYLAVLIGNEDFQIKTIERDEQLINDIINKEVNFWNSYVVTKQIPNVVSCKDSNTLSVLFPNATYIVPISLPTDTDQMIEMIEALEADYKALSGQIDQKKNELKLLLKDSETGLSSRYCVTWKNQKANRLNTEALKIEMPEIYSKYLREQNTRVLRIKERKGE